MPPRAKARARSLNSQAGLVSNYQSHTTAGHCRSLQIAAGRRVRATFHGCGKFKKACWKAGLAVNCTRVDVCVNNVYCL